MFESCFSNAAYNKEMKAMLSYIYICIYAHIYMHNTYISSTSDQACEGLLKDMAMGFLLQLQKELQNYRKREGVTYLNLQFIGCTFIIGSYF